MIASECMTAPVATVREDATLEEVARLMLERRITAVPVVDGKGKLTGIVSRSDFEVRNAPVPFSAYRAPKLFGRWVSDARLEELYREARAMTARDVMSAPVITATEDEPLSRVVRRMIENDVSRIPVVRDGTPVGMISHRTLLQLMVEPEG